MLLDCILNQVFQVQFLIRRLQFIKIEISDKNKYRMQNQIVFQSDTSVQFPTSSQLPEPEGHPVQQRTQVELRINDVAYKVSERLFREQQLYLNLTCYYWLNVSVFDCTLAYLTFLPIQPSYYANYLPFFSGKTITVLMAFIGLLVNRKLIKAQILWFVANLLVYCFIATVFFGSQIHYQMVTAITFVILQIRIKPLFTTNAKNIPLYSLISIQIILIAAKSDGIINAAWPGILSIGLLLAAYSLVIGLKKLIIGFPAFWKQQTIDLPTLEIIFSGAFYLGLSLEAATLMMSLILENNLVIIALFSSIYHFLIIGLFYMKYDKEIAVYRAKRRQLIEPGWMKFVKIEQATVLYKLSANWLDLKPRGHQIQPEDAKNQEEKETQGINECAVCLNDLSTLVWMPCGHLSICEDCGHDLLTNSKFDCVLCKSKAEVIYKIDRKELETNKSQYKSSYSYKIND